MKNVAHPNMFPSAGEAVAVAPDGDAKPIVNGTLALEIAPPASPWANPVSRLKSAAGAKAAAEEPAPKERRISRSEQAVAYLRANGPATGAQLLTALGIQSKGGITPFIGPGLQRGEIVKDGNRYALPCHLVGHLPTQRASAAPAETHSQPAPKDSAEKPAAPAAPASSTPAPERKPDFTLSADETLVVAWPDGSVTVQRGGVFVELTPNEARLLRAFVGLRQ
ncbi:hypothetical protein [Paraburkholderia acidiphila]|uniref:Uncharacterized protein n=1 Tax=Paraburkholderia acidiphila TaxID=2571747 RepID=A0A7Z2G7X6_9BURK|nr:hypothetical protein [Paraburkholderia acidiphila]QGZ56714.1 hypothetical protein FAZ97_17260 [Paraburkholderia acidiphila]